MTAPTLPYEQIDEARCRFPLAHALPGGVRRFRSPADAAGVPIAEAVMAVSGIAEVVVTGQELTARKDPGLSWTRLAPQVRYAVDAAEAASERGPTAPAGAVADDQIFTVAQGLLDRDINPSVAKHGGRVELIDVQDGVAVVRMLGGCHGCGMASVTLKQGVESALRRVPGVSGLRDVTDHASGTNPYFARG
ncbi:MAG TPA: NifU family protein [Gemmatimonadales bacterium]|jgi:Fe-S cluster biogenesis protein NfuA